MPRATPSLILGALAPVGGARWAGKVVWGVGGTHLDEKWGSPKIAQKSIKRRKKVVGRPKSVSVEVFLGSMDPGLSFDVYYSLRDPLVAALEFFENRKIWRKTGENRVVGGPRSEGGWWAENRFFAISRDWGWETLRNFQEWRGMMLGGFRESLVAGMISIMSLMWVH